MGKVAVYMRVSTREQFVENQLPQLERWVADRGHQLVAVYSENESAWMSGHQRELARLVQDAKKGRFNFLLTWSLDRLSRQGSLAILSLVHKLSRYGVRVVSLQETWTEAPGELAEILYAIAGWVARMESQRRSERTKAGLVRVRAAGVRLGRPPGARDKKRRKKRSVRNGVFFSTDLGREF
ncbi:MAG: recombinase family protein [Dehalococcoidia bacterium]|nr:recombinase family protein [Dehalococcoidia bacterium]